VSAQEAIDEALLSKGAEEIAADLEERRTKNGGKLPLGIGDAMEQCSGIEPGDDRHKTSHVGHFESQVVVGKGPKISHFATLSTPEMPTASAARIRPSGAGLGTVRRAS
jgi:hypothetical protein